VVAFTTCVVFHLGYSEGDLEGTRLGLIRAEIELRMVYSLAL